MSAVYEPVVGCCVLVCFWALQLGAPGYFQIELARPLFLLRDIFLLSVNKLTYFGK